MLTQQKFFKRDKKTTKFIELNQNVYTGRPKICTSRVKISLALQRKKFKQQGGTIENFLARFVKNFPTIFSLFTHCK
jgi:uncharacterized protein (DUF433 family)